jgi:hypothetical protein
MGKIYVSPPPHFEEIFFKKSKRAITPSTFVQPKYCNKIRFSIW